jgi:hypothetical protein
MALSMAEKNARKRDARAAKKTGDALLKPLADALAPKAKTNGKAEIVDPKAETKRPTLTLVKKSDPDMPDFLNRTDPENEKKAVVDRDKAAEAARNRPLPSAPPPTKAELTLSKAAKAKPAKSAKAKSVYQVTGELVVMEPNITIEALMKAVQKVIPDARQITVATFRADCRNKMLMIQALRGIDLGVK